MAGLRLHGENASEHGSSEPEGLGANRRMSHAVGEEAELTKAADAVETKRCPQNERQTTVSGSEAPCARAQSEREGRVLG